MEWHFWFGYATPALDLFRIAVGISDRDQPLCLISCVARGGRRYLRRRFPQPQATSATIRSAAGQWACAVCVLVQTVTGLFMSDEMALSRRFTSDGDDEDVGPFVDAAIERMVKLMTRASSRSRTVASACCRTASSSRRCVITSSGTKPVSRTMLSGRKKRAGRGARR
jgi:cytochrome b